RRQRDEWQAQLIGQVACLLQAADILRGQGDLVAQVPKSDGSDTHLGQLAYDARQRKRGDSRAQRPQHREREQGNLAILEVLEGWQTCPHRRTPGDGALEAGGACQHPRLPAPQDAQRLAHRYWPSWVHEIHRREWKITSVNAEYTKYAEYTEHT